MSDHTTFKYVVSLNDIMCLHMSNLGTIKPEGACYVFPAIIGIKFTEIGHNMAFYWYSDLISHTKT